MNEIIPLVGGLIVGLLIPILADRHRFVVGVIAAFAVGVVATLVSGEYRIGWEYLLFDVPLAALAITAGYLAHRRLEWVRRPVAWITRTR